jgi:hypothetical protein
VGIHPPGELEQRVEVDALVGDLEAGGERDVVRLAHAEELEEPHLLDLDLVAGLEQGHLLLPHRDLGAPHVERRHRADLGAGLREGELGVRRGEERVLQRGARRLLEHVDVALGDRGAEPLVGARHGGVGRRGRWRAAASG